MLATVHWLRRFPCSCEGRKVSSNDLTIRRLRRTDPCYIFALSCRPLVSASFANVLSFVRNGNRRAPWTKHGVLLLISVARASISTPKHLFMLPFLAKVVICPLSVCPSTVSDCLPPSRSIFAAAGGHLLCFQLKRPFLIEFESHTCDISKPINAPLKPPLKGECKRPVHADSSGKVELLFYTSPELLITVGEADEALPWRGTVDAMRTDLYTKYLGGL